MNSNSRLIVVGGGGYVGRAIVAAAAGRFEVVVTSSSSRDGVLTLNLERPESFEYAAVRPSDTILLAAAISAPDICASQPDYARAVNVLGTSAFAERVIERGAKVIFFSSDAVYGEHEAEFDEGLECSPAGDYAEMKCEVERRFADNEAFKSIRLSYVFSREDKFTRYLIGCAEKGVEAELFHPFCRAIVHRQDVVEGALALAERWDEFPQRCINFGGPEVLSRLDFAEALRQVALPALKYRKVEPDAQFFVNRPRVISMRSDVLPQLLGRASRTLREAVAMEFEVGQ